MIKLNDIKVSVDYTDSEIKKAAAIKLKIKENRIKSVDIVRRSIDARYFDVRFSLGIIADIEGYTANPNDDEAAVLLDFPSRTIKLNERPVIVGAGPAGIFAALVLAESGTKPILIERGQAIEDRKRQISDFQKTGRLDTESNVCFGEGGAGTFSDGKLTTRVNNPLSYYILNTFVANGASTDILVDAKPHIGTDVLSDILISIRKKIISLGGEVCFGEKMTDIDIKGEKVNSIKTSTRDIPCENVIIAAGHGARDVYELANSKNFQMEAKGFAVGLRIEHPREMIDRAIYRQYAGHPRLGAASYSLKGSFGGRTVYSFCMCPGGEVINSSTEQGALCVNGMSYNARDGVNSNAAVVAQIDPSDWGKEPMGGIEYQRNLERLSFQAAGSDFSAPVQRLGDFRNNKKTKAFSNVLPSIKGRYSEADINKILGENTAAAIKEATSYWDRQINGFAMDDAVLTAVESRTSAPIRILRDENLQAVGISGLYPCGEGAGYAGGIMSAAMDGIRCALQILKSAEK
ncbi:MAG: FAD-dependent oxidoreductase [Clostridia bacterium]|nr:FAD-dependent oxidoreductase [Clostridia bacterium]